MNGTHLNLIVIVISCIFIVTLIVKESKKKSN